MAALPKRLAPTAVDNIFVHVEVTNQFDCSCLWHRQVELLLFWSFLMLPVSSLLPTVQLASLTDYALNSS